MVFHSQIALYVRLRGCVRLADVKSNKRYAFAKKLDTPGKALTIQHVISL